MHKISLSDGLAIGGVVLTTVLVALDKAGKLNGPLPLMLLFIAALMTVPLALGNSWVLGESSKTTRIFRKLIMLSVVVLIYSALVYWIFPGNDSETAQMADLSLRFVNPKSPTLIIVNKSTAVAKEMKWAVVLWNVDRPDMKNPLPIPVGGFDWIKPNNHSSAINLFDGPLVAPLLQSGNKLLGTGWISCTVCKEDKNYVVSIEWGKGGWYAEIKLKNPGVTFVPGSQSEKDRGEFFAYLESISPEYRMPIVDESELTRGVIMSPVLQK